MGDSGDGDVTVARNDSEHQNNQASVNHQTSDHHSTKSLGTTYVEIQDIPKKGKGLVARSKIHKGWRIMSEAPFLTAPVDIRDWQLDILVAEQLKIIGRPLTLRFFACFNRFTDKPFSGRFRSNALPHGGDPKTAGMFDTMGYINHSCLPNALPSWDPEKHMANVHALRDIDKGEEITATYTHGPSAERRRDLKRLWDFDCECSLCSLSPLELEKNDAYQTEIQFLGKRQRDVTRRNDFPNECLEDCHRLIQLVEKEAVGQAEPGLATVYEDATAIAIRHSDQARASVFSERAYAAKVICEGADNPVTRLVKDYGKDPSIHEDFAFFDTWASTTSMIPYGMDESQFERWLWGEVTWYLWFPFGYIMGK